MSNLTMQRRAFIIALGLLQSIAAVAGKPQVLVEVWKNPSCGCCKDWVAHLIANGFDVKVTEADAEAMRKKLGIPQQLGSCHTALVAGYAIEGHVPAREIRRLLAERPRAVGLAVPGMRVGSPGMDGPAYGSRRDPYDVILVPKSGEPIVYASYRS